MNHQDTIARAKPAQLNSSPLLRASAVKIPHSLYA